MSIVCDPFLPICNRTRHEDTHSLVLDFFLVLERNIAGWDRDLFDFEAPRGLRLNLSLCRGADGRTSQTRNDCDKLLGEESTLRTL